MTTQMPFVGIFGPAASNFSAPGNIVRLPQCIQHTRDQRYRISILLW